MILDYGVMVTQQILVLFFLVRVRVVQLIQRFGSPHGEEPNNKFGLWCNGNTTDSGPVFLGSNPSSPTARENACKSILSLFLHFMMCPKKGSYKNHIRALKMVRDDGEHLQVVGGVVGGDDTCRFGEA